MGPSAPKGLAAVLACLVLSTATSVSSVTAEEEYILYLNVDETKVNFLSGNFSVAVTRDWPRAIFRHEQDYLSPTFEVSCPRMYLFNDLNEDGLFDLTEVNRTVFLDSAHVDWNLTSEVLGYSDEYRQYASVTLGAFLNAYIVAENETKTDTKWARLTFSFNVTESPVSRTNARGTYTVEGKTSMRMNFSLEILSPIETDAVVLEHHLQGGASTNMFHLLEGSDGGDTTVTVVQATVDEREFGEDFTNDFRETLDPIQKICFSKEDGLEQAFYSWSSEAVAETEEGTTVSLVNSSYFTTGAGMTLHSMFPVTNATLSVQHESVIGIMEEGFGRSIGDWAKDNLLIVLLAVSAAIILPLTLIVRRKCRTRSLRCEDKVDEE